MFFLSMDFLYTVLLFFPTKTTAYFSMIQQTKLTVEGGRGEGAGTAKLNTGIPTTFITAAADQLSSPDSSRCGEVYRGRGYVY
jgi:hypothetical protein